MLRISNPLSRLVNKHVKNYETTPYGSHVIMSKKTLNQMLRDMYKDAYKTGVEDHELHVGWQRIMEEDRSGN